MNDIWYSPMFGITLTCISYVSGLAIFKRLRTPLANPLIIATCLCIGFLQLTRIPLEAYWVGGSFLMVFIFPATTCLAVSVYTKIDLLKKHAIPIIVSCSVGAAVSIFSVVYLQKIFGLSDLVFFSLLPKSVTTAVALELSQILQGEPSLTIMAVMITGMGGVLFGPLLFSIFHIRNPLTIGISLGTSSHVIGTTKALEYGDTEGAMSSIAIFVTSMATVIISLLFL